MWPDGESAPLLALSQIDWSPPVSSARVRARDVYDGSVQPLGYRIVLPSLGLRAEL